MSIEVVAWSPLWARSFDAAAVDLRTALATGTMNVRNHLAVRDMLKARDDLRDAYAAVKLSLAADPDLDIDTDIARISAVAQRVLEASSEFSPAELVAIRRLNDPDA